MCICLSITCLFFHQFHFDLKKTISSNFVCERSNSLKIGPDMLWPDMLDCADFSTSLRSSVWLLKNDNCHWKSCNSSSPSVYLASRLNWNKMVLHARVIYFEYILTSQNLFLFQRSVFFSRERKGAIFTKHPFLLTFCLLLLPLIWMYFFTSEKWPSQNTGRDITFFFVLCLRSDSRT